MPILSGDVKLLASQTMLDVPEGGGAPTATLIADGSSNAIFPDVSETDRAGGRVSTRKVFAAVHTDSVDQYFGANVIIAEPPADPRVSVTAFATSNFFDTCTSAVTRMESYLYKGATWGGFLYENHIVGQRVIQIFQRPSAEVVRIGHTLVLVQNEGLSNEVIQYVRATAVSQVTRTFYDEATHSDYTASIVSVSLSDALLHDFTGSSANRNFSRATGSCLIRDTVVADAGTYISAVPLARAASINDFSVEAKSVYTQLVPSAQTETPLVDVRMGGIAGSLIATGSAVTLSLTSTFTTAQNLFIGAGVFPGSLSVVRSGVTVTDAGGTLVCNGAQCGTIDYENGILALTSNVFGASGGTHAITYIPADVPPMVSDSYGIPITVENRSLSYVTTLPTTPAPVTLSVAYLSGGRWYVLRDNGAGVLKGSDSAYGVGTLNYSTSSVVVTLGALPDVGSAIIMQWYSPSQIIASANTELFNSGKVYAAINTSGQLSNAAGSKPITINSLTMSWAYGGVTKNAADNGLGALTGDATGIVDYTAGVVYWSPNAMPASGTTVLMDANGGARQAGATDCSVHGGLIGGTNLTPGSVSLTATGTFAYTAPGSHLGEVELTRSLTITDDGQGHLRFIDGTNGYTNCGTVNYSTGQINLYSTPTTVSIPDKNGPSVTTTTSYSWHIWVFPWDKYLGTKTRNLYFMPQSASAVSYSVTVAGAGSVSVVVTAFMASTIMAPTYTLRGVSFEVGSDRYIGQTDGTLAKNPSATTGAGTPAGSVTPATGVITLSSWTTGSAPAILNWRALQAPPSEGLSAPFASSKTTIRTASSPLRPSSVSVIGTMLDGTSFNVSSDADGKINGTRVKGTVDYEYGTVQLYFCNPSGVYGNHDLTALQIPGVTTVPMDLCKTATLRYNAVAYSYLPLDASILGIDPVRLPSDGRVPIFRPGGFVVVGHTGEITATVSNGQTVNAGRVRLSRVRVIGHDGVVINTGYSADLEAGTVTFSDVSGYSQPVTIQHRIEDMMMASDVQLNGQLTFTRALTHEYPLGSYVSSAIVAGDLRARVSILFDQATWDGTYKDAVSGSAATATFNAAQYPIAVSNRGALTERWIVRFTNTTAFDVIGENVGLIATGNISTNCAPINPATSVPYFTIPALGWGAGWAAGNVLRFNTVGAMFPVWLVRTVQQGPETVTNDSFTLLIRGDIDTP